MDKTYEDQLERYIKHIKKLRKLVLFYLCFEKNEDTRDYLNQIGDITLLIISKYNCEKSCSIQLYDKLSNLMDSVTKFTSYEEGSYEDLKSCIYRLQHFQNRIEKKLENNMNK